MQNHQTGNNPIVCRYLSSDYFRRKETKSAGKIPAQEFYFFIFITLHERKTNSFFSDSDGDGDGDGDGQIKKLVPNNTPKSTKE